MNVQNHCRFGGIENRSFIPCPSLPQDPSAQIIRCSLCSELTFRCCAHRYEHQLDDQAYAGIFDAYKYCHHRRLAITDGSCLNNGKKVASAGLGVYTGTEQGEAPSGNYTSAQNAWSVPVNDDVDPVGPRTSSRAELLAAIEGLRMMKERYGVKYDEMRRLQVDGKKSEWIIVTDSQYVVLGITIWYHQWEANGGYLANGNPVLNLDLFRQLDWQIREIEAYHHVIVGFWHVTREHTTRADMLAKKAAKIGWFHDAYGVR